MEAGLNLYSLRSLIRTEAEFLDTAGKLREMGYSYLQYSGGPYDPAMLRRVSLQAGLPICLTHVPLDRILNDTDRLMEEHALFGCKNIGLGSIPFKILSDEEQLKATVEQLNEAGRHMAENGFHFFYHHHHFEFIKYHGVTVFDYIFNQAPFINFTADTYWLQYGGVDVEKTVAKLKGRVGCIHLKDYKIEYDPETKSCRPVFAPVGDGTIDFLSLRQTMLDADVQYFLVEQDNACEFASPLEQVERSIRYLKTL